MSNGEARQIHSTRPLSERLEDESRTDVLTTDFERWLSDPNKFDMPHVDEKSPLRFVRRERSVPDKKEIRGRIVARDGEGREVGFLKYIRKEDEFRVDAVKVNPYFKGRGYGVYLMREAVNFQDELCVPGKLVPWPYIYEKIPGHSERQKMENWRNRVDFLLKLYGSFGFVLDPEFTPDDCKDFGECSMTRPPVCEVKHEQW